MPPGRVPRLTRGRRPNTSGLAAAVAGCSLALQAVGGGGKPAGSGAMTDCRVSRKLLSRRGLGARKWGPAAATRGGTTEHRCVKQKTHKQPLWEAASLERELGTVSLRLCMTSRKFPPAVASAEREENDDGPAWW